MSEIMASYHDYVPKYANGDPHEVLMPCDGLSVDRAIEAQGIMANCSSKVKRLEGLVPAVQDFHKRQLQIVVSYSAKMIRPESK